MGKFVTGCLLDATVRQCNVNGKLYAVTGVYRAMYTIHYCKMLFVA